MRPRSRRFVTRLPLITLAVCISVCLAAMSGASTPNRPPLQAPAAELPLVAVAVGDLQREAPAWMGRSVRFTFQFQTSPTEWNPYLTRFGPGDYVAAVGWGDDQFLWKAADFERPSVLLFARRGTPQAEVLAKAETYGRYEVVGRVAQIFLGLPWIQIDRVERLPEEVGEGAILHVTRALRSMESADWSRALEDLARAEVSNLPPAARAELAELRAECVGALEARKLPRLR